MTRRITLTAVLVALTALYAGAASHRATLILTDGERKSGPLAVHGGDHETIINNVFQLQTDDGKEIDLPLDQVAVIDFASGGHPGSDEIQRLPFDNTNMLVLRTGYSERGKLLNLINGDTVRWQNEGGQTQQYAITDVSRIYLNPSAARSALSSRSSGAAAVGTSGVAATPGAVQVNANQAWTDAGVTVEKGDRVSFQTSGQISFGNSPGQTAGPDGNPDVKNPAYPVPVAGAGALIGKVGNSAAFPIGSNTAPITMPADGRLMLGVNDNELGDNSGAFSVVVKKQ